MALSLKILGDEVLRLRLEVARLKEVAAARDAEMAELQSRTQAEWSEQYRRLTVFYTAIQQHIAARGDVVDEDLNEPWRESLRPDDN
jgi:hypothetical protein